jgi:hypothetical protein
METPKPHQGHEWYNFLVARNLVAGTPVLPAAEPWPSHGRRPQANFLSASSRPRPFAPLSSPMVFRYTFSPADNPCINPVNLLLLL